MRASPARVTIPLVLADVAFQVRIGHTPGSSGSYTCSFWSGSVDDLPAPVELMSFHVE